jgi:sulfonate transport system permease protein
MKWVRALTLPLLLLALLELWARTIGKNSDSLAAPSSASLAFFRATGDGSLLASTSFTLGSAAAGLVIGCLFGVLGGTLLGLSKRAASVSFLSIELLRPIPSVALIPLAMLVFGFGFRLEISVVAFACFWPILILTQAAVQQVEPCLLEVAQALQLSQREQFIKIVLPAIIPRLFVALRLGVAIALVVAVTVEIAANPHGMGYAIIYAQQSLDPALMLAWLFWIGVVGFAINFFAMKLQVVVSTRMGADTTLGSRSV